MNIVLNVPCCHIRISLNVHLVLLLLLIHLILLLLQFFPVGYKILYAIFFLLYFVYSSKHFYGVKEFKYVGQQNIY